MLNSYHDMHTVYENTMTFLPHCCNDYCIVNNPDGTLRHRKLDNKRVSKDNKRHQFIPLPN